MDKHIIPMILVCVLLFAGCSLPVNREDKITPDTEEPYTSEDRAVPETPVEGVKENTGSQENNIIRIPLVLYYQSEDGSVIPVTRRVAKQEGIARAAINAIIDSALLREELEYYGLYPVIPAGTEILGLNIKEGLATIDFNENFLEYDSKIAERNIITSVVYTLTGFKTIENVKILVKGRVVETMKFGTDISDNMNRDNILINTSSVNLEEGVSKSDAYFLKYTDSGYVYVLPISFQLPREDSNVPAEIISFLASKTEYENAFSEIPKGTKLLEKTINNKVLSLNFSKELFDYGGAERESGVLKQILYSMGQMDDVERIRMQVEGKAAILPEGTDISKEVPLPTAINDVIDG